MIVRLVAAVLELPRLSLASPRLATARMPLVTVVTPE